MKDTGTLAILQYNVRNDRVTMMVPLLADPRTQEYDIIAVKEPWRNPHAATTLSSYQSGFHLLYRPGGDTKVCFYVNDRIDPDSWDVSYPSADLCSLAVKVGNGPPDLINIHNVYNPSPASYSSTDSPSTIPIAKQQLQGEGEHILLGDFNLHHPYWSGPSRPTQHAAADALLEAVQSADMNLTLPRGTVTWEARNSYSTIDLVFMTENLSERLEHCKVRPEMDQSSDHIPISTKLRFATEPVPVRKKRMFKKTDMEQAEKCFKDVPVPQHLRTKEEIDLYVVKVQSFLKLTIEKSVPWAKPSAESKPF